MGLKEWDAQRRAKAKANLDRMKQDREDAKGAREAGQGTHGITAAVEAGQVRAKKEIQRLPDHLDEGEQVHALGSGMCDNASGVAVVTDRRFMFVSENIGRRTTRDLNLSKVSSVQWSPKITGGTLEVAGSGASIEVKLVPNTQGQLISQHLRRLTA